MMASSRLAHAAAAFLLAACSGSGGGSEFANLPSNDPRSAVLRGLRVEQFVGYRIDNFSYPVGDPLRAVFTAASITGVEWTAQQMDSTGTATTTWSVRSVTEPAMDGAGAGVMFEVEVVDVDTQQAFRCPASIRYGELTWGPTPDAQGYCLRQPTMHRARWRGTFEGTVPGPEVGRAQFSPNQRNRAYRLQVDDSNGLTASGTLTISVDDGHGTPWHPVVVPFGAHVGVVGALFVDVPTGSGTVKVAIVGPGDSPLSDQVALYWGRLAPSVVLDRR